MSKGWMRVQPGGGDGPEVAAEPGYRLTQGDVLVLDTPREEEPEVDDKVDVLFKDEGSGLLGVNKSGNLPVSESGKYRKNSLGCILEERLGRPVWSMHRLDKETSGCVLLALSDTAARRVAGRFADGAVRKLYHAVLQGEMHTPTETSRPIGPFWKFTGEDYCSEIPSMKKIRWAPAPPGRESDGKTCRTLFTPLRVANGLTLAQVEIWQGRTHQIRVHAEHLGFPLLGDKIYGHGAGSEKKSLAMIRGEEECRFGDFGVVNRHLLHASRLEVKEGAGPGRNVLLVADPIPVLLEHGGEGVRRLLSDPPGLPLVHRGVAAAGKESKEGKQEGAIPSGIVATDGAEEGSAE
eukprot:Hpha_TRINITY_DN1655_c0_g1::TRINITY_DN1655_c0_g1_i1::g.48772::m.48772/K06180/rluD; 23S rRNA pseudouridine1911/1915/1917 synthase